MFPRTFWDFQFEIEFRPIDFYIPNRFPCKIGNCKKEYRTQWELNSHQRLKHQQSETIPTAIEQNESNFIDAKTIPKIEIHSVEVLPAKRRFNQSNQSTPIIKDDSTQKKKIKKSNEQIIYVMPGPTIENVS